MPCPTELPNSLITLIPDLTRAARRMTRNPDSAQDLSQEVLLKLWTRLQDGEQIDNLRAYAMTSLRNQYRQSLRDRIVTDDLDDQAFGIAPQVFATLALKEVEEAISRLPSEQARLMQLVASGETSPLDLARLTGWPLGTVMSRLARARAQLRQKMSVDSKAPLSGLI